MKKILLKPLSMLLVLAMLVPMFAACSENKETQEETSNDAPAAIDSVEDTSAEDLGDPTHYETGLEKVDMGGKTFTILSSNWDVNGYQQYEIWAEETTGEPINDAIYDRNLYMLENFNCNVAVVPAYNRLDGQNMFTQSITANDNAYDIFFQRLNWYQNLATGGYLMDLADLPYVNYDNIYWDKASYDAFSVSNVHFAVCSDITLVDKTNTSMMVFNKEMYDELQLPDPYQMVLDGKWTLDVLKEHVVMVSDDLNGDSVMDTNDRYGLNCERDTLTSLFNAAGMSTAIKDENDVPQFILGNEAETTMMLKIMDLMYDTDHVINVMIPAINGTQFFQNNHSLYMWTRGSAVFNLREMEVDFGILPNPKADEQQENYYSDVNSWTSICMVLPINIPEDMLDWTGIFLEEYACQGRNMLVPVFYDTLLAGKIARDEESKAMLDIIFDNRFYDIGAIGGWGDWMYNFVYMTMSYNNSVAAYVKSNQKGIGKRIQTMVDAVNAKYAD